VAFPRDWADAGELPSAAMVKTIDAIAIRSDFMLSPAFSPRTKKPRIPDQEFRGSSLS
jgi:hypothetical protein